MVDRSLAFAHTMSLSILAYCSIIFVVGWIIAHALLVAKPIKGIPYNTLARYMPWGDLITLGIYNWTTGEVFSWFSLQCLKHKSPIIQLFIPSFSTYYPTLVLADLREIADMVTKRTGEIDRADLMHTWFGLVSPKATIGLKSRDSTFKAQRRLWNVVLSPRFLEEVASERFWEVAVVLAELWTRKAGSVGAKMAFKAQDDIKLATLDGIWKMNVGSDLGLLEAKLMRLRHPNAWWKTWGGTAVFAPTKMPAFYRTLNKLLMCLDWVMQGISPRLYTWVFQVTGILGRADQEKNAILNDTITARRGISCSTGGTDDSILNCALDEVFRKDFLLGAGDGQPSEAATDAALRDELLELLITGHETTASSIAWALKYLTDNPITQVQLRKSLQAAFPQAGPSDLPSAKDIFTASLSYVDCVIAETLRLSNTGPVSFRQTVTQCNILGHTVPAGTPIILVTAGPSYSDPSMPWTPEHLRSKTSQAFSPLGQTSLYSKQTHHDLTLFDPTRWLRDDGTTFNPDAISMLPFSAGPRGCFGKRIALLEMKIVLTVLILTFEFPTLAKKLSGYSAIDGLTRRPRYCYVKPKKREETVEKFLTV